MGANHVAYGAVAANILNIGFRFGIFDEYERVEQLKPMLTDWFKQLDRMAFISANEDVGRNQRDRTQIGVGCNVLGKDPRCLGL